MLAMDGVPESLRPAAKTRCIRFPPLRGSTGLSILFVNPNIILNAENCRVRVPIMPPSRHLKNLHSQDDGTFRKQQTTNGRRLERSSTALLNFQEATRRRRGAGSPVFLQFEKWSVYTLLYLRREVSVVEGKLEKLVQTFSGEANIVGIICKEMEKMSLTRVSRRNRGPWR